MKNILICLSGLSKGNVRFRLACNDTKAFFYTFSDIRRTKIFQNVYDDALLCLWVILSLDLALSYAGKVLVSRWVQIVLLL